MSRRLQEEEPVVDEPVESGDATEELAGTGCLPGETACEEAAAE